MALQGVIHARGTRNLTASEIIAANLLVELGTTAGQINLHPAGGRAWAVAYDAIASGAVGEVQLLTPGDVVYSLASATIAVGDYLKAAASGQVAPEASPTTWTADTIGQAEEAASGAAVGFHWSVI